MPRSTNEERMLRRLARPINRELRLAGLPVPKTHHCIEVHISAIEMPDWPVRMTLRGFANTPTSVVLKSRGHAAELAKLDRAGGGKPTWDRFEYRRCNACGRLLVRKEASQMREWERVHPRQKALCGPEFCGQRSDPPSVMRLDLSFRHISEEFSDANVRPRR